MEGLGEVGEVSKKGKVIPQSEGNVIQGGDTGSNPLWLRDLGTFDGDGEDSGGDTHRVSEEVYGEAGAAECRRDVGNFQDRSSKGSGRKPVGNDLFLEEDKER